MEKVVEEEEAKYRNGANSKCGDGKIDNNDDDDDDDDDDEDVVSNDKHEGKADSSFTFNLR